MKVVRTYLIEKKTLAKHIVLIIHSGNIFEIERWKYTYWKNIQESAMRPLSQMGHKIGSINK